MNDRQERERLFSVLRQTLKSKRVTYAVLAEGLGISELSVKRLFKDKDCKMSRILDICALLNMSLTDLFQMSERVTRHPQYLPEHIETALAKDKSLFTLFIFLVSQLELPLIKKVWGVDEAHFYLSLRALEKLELIELNNHGGFRFIVPLPIRWRLKGPLSQTLKQVNQNYIGYCFDHAAEPSHCFNSASRLMTIDSAEKIQGQLQAVRQEFESLSTQDQLFFDEKELALYKIVMAMAPFPVQDMMPFE